MIFLTIILFLQTIVEIKCPLKCLREDIATLATLDPEFCLDYDYKTGTIKLKENHDYYVQIQGQLHCSRR